MRLELEQADIDLIAQRVTNLLKPLLASSAKQEEKDVLLDVTQLAVYLNVSKAWVYDRIRENEIPHPKFGKYLRFRKREIDKWIETQSFKPLPALKVVSTK